MVKRLRPTVDLVFIFLAEKEDKIIKNREVGSCTSFILTKFLSRGQLLIQEAIAINGETVKPKYLRINLKLGLSSHLLNKTKEYHFSTSVSINPPASKPRRYRYWLLLGKTLQHMLAN